MFAFSCYNTASKFYGLSYIQCASQYKDSMAIDATFFSVGASTGIPRSALMSSGDNLHAVAIVYTTPV